MAPIDTDDDQPLLQASRLGFEVLHFQRSFLDPDSSIIVHHIGIFHTFALAQAAALVQLQRTLNDYLHRGYYGRYYDTIEFHLRGLITAYKESTVDGYMLRHEVPMSEFRLETLDVRDNVREAEAHHSGEELRFANSRGGIITDMQRAVTTRPVVRLPVKPEQHKEPATTMHIAKRGEHVVMPESAPPSPQFPPPGFQYDEERQPEWSRTRMPLFNRRDDGPFRRPGNTPYAQVMTFSPPAPISAAQFVTINPRDSMEGAEATS